MAVDLAQLGMSSGQTNDNATRASDLLTQIATLVQQYVSMPDADPNVSAAFQQLGQQIAGAMGGASPAEDMSAGGGAPMDAEDAQDGGVDESTEQDANAVPNGSAGGNDQSQDQGMARPTDSYSQAREGATAFLKSKNKKAKASS